MCNRCYLHLKDGEVNESGPVHALPLCPSCRGEINQRNRYAERLIAAIPLPCLHRDGGCSFFGTPEALSTHYEKVCSCMPCTFTGCTFRGTNKERVIHERFCPLRQVPCCYSSSCDPINIQKLPAHFRDVHGFELSEHIEEGDRLAIEMKFKFGEVYSTCLCYGESIIAILCYVDESLLTLFSPVSFYHNSTCQLIADVEMPAKNDLTLSSNTIVHEGSDKSLQSLVDVIETTEGFMCDGVPIAIQACTKDLVLTRDSSDEEEHSLCIEVTFHQSQQPRKRTRTMG